jgi:hypothetical protein
MFLVFTNGYLWPSDTVKSPIFIFSYFYAFIYLYYLFIISFSKNSIFSNIFYNENNFKFFLYFCLIRCRFEVWKKKTNLIFFSSMVSFLFLSLSILFHIFCHLFLNFLLRLFYYISLFSCLNIFILYFFHFFSFLKCLKKVSNC